MTMIKLTAMSGWDRDMNLNPVLNAKRNSELLALSGCMFSCSSACTAVFFVFFLKHFTLLKVYKTGIFVLSTVLPGCYGLDL